jgi:hypothetical protein
MMRATFTSGGGVRRTRKAENAPSGGVFFGADDRARTGDPDLGKVVLYQLSYVRVGTSILAEGDGASNSRIWRTGN